MISSTQHQEDLCERRVQVLGKEIKNTQERLSNIGVGTS